MFYVKYNVLRTSLGISRAMPYTPELVAKQEDPRLPRAADSVSSPRLSWLPFAVIALLLAVLYYRVGIKLVYDWATLQDYSHGPLVPLFAAFLVWDKRKAIKATPIKQSWAGIFPVLFAIVVLILGVYGVELFTARMSFVLMLTGIIWTLCGWAMVRELRFPLLVLVLAIPFPAIVFNQITFPLQLFASRIASEILPVLRVPVLLEGNIIRLPVMPLEVAEACSGIRSLMSLFTLAVFYGYFLERTTARRVILALASIPIAVTANVVRIVGTGLCVQYWDPDKALGFFHEFSGWVVFVIALGCLYLVHRAMRLISPVKAKSS
jgi:exosortase